MHRERVPTCTRNDTFRYFLDRENVVPVWQALAARYGHPGHNRSFRTMEITAPAFWLRASVLGNPITVVRRRGCTPADVAELHALLGFAE